MMGKEAQEKALVYEQQRQFMEQHKHADTFSYDLDGMLVSVLYTSPIQKWKEPVPALGSSAMGALSVREWFTSDEKEQPE